MTSSVERVIPPKDDIQIRNVTSNDLLDICRLVADNNVHESFALPPFAPAEIVRKLYISDFEFNRIVASLNGEVVGWAGLNIKIAPRSHSASVSLMVRSDHWSKGIGRKLMESLIHSADNFMGYTRLELDVLEENKRAICLYESLGFEREGLQRNAVLYKGKLTNQILMARVLE